MYKTMISCCLAASITLITGTSHAQFSNPFGKKKETVAKALDLDFSFKYPGAPSDEVERFFFYGEQIPATLFNLHEQQLGLIQGFVDTYNIEVSTDLAQSNAQLTADFDAGTISEAEYEKKSAEAEAQYSNEALAALENWKAPEASEKQKQWLEVNLPKAIGVAGASVLLITDCAKLPDQLNAAKDRATNAPMLKKAGYALLLKKIPGIAEQTGTAIPLIVPSFTNFGEILVVWNRIGKAEGIEPATSEKEKNLLIVASASTAAGEEVEADF